MNRFDARGVLASALLRGGRGAKKNGAVIAFRCLRHDDRTASAWLGDHAWGCMACGFTEPLATLADALGVTLPADGARSPNDLTVAAYAERKGLTIAALTSYGVHDHTGQYGDTLVAIPYHDVDGRLLRTKLRSASKSWWAKDGTGTPLYGLDRLASSRGPVLIVEGESDCHAAWQRGVAAVGVPGANAWRLEYGPLFSGRDVIVWQEPDQGGSTLVQAVAKSLPMAKVLRDVRLDPRGSLAKDFGDLHQAAQAAGLDADGWLRAWRGILTTATPIGAEPPAVAFDSISGDTLEQIFAAKMAPIDAVPTPLEAWNACCAGGGGGIGLARGWTVTIGANTGTGKSLIALNLAARAIEAGEVVTFVSLEMGRDDLATRLMAIASGERVAALEQGPRFEPEAFTRAALHLDDIRARTGGHVLVNRRPISKLVDIAAVFRYHAEVYGCRYFLVDYLQLAWTSPSHSETERILHVSHTLRELTQTHGCVTVNLSQFNRAVSGNRAERPVIQGLRGGSDIENDSHQVLLFDHSRFTRTGDHADTWLLLDKNRNGPVADIPVRWNYRTLRLEARSPDDLPPTIARPDGPTGVPTGGGPRASSGRTRSTKGGAAPAAPKDEPRAWWDD